MVQASDGVQALCEMEQRHVDVVVTDYHMPRLTGLDLLLQSHMTWPEIPVILFSGFRVGNARADRGPRNLCLGSPVI